MVFVQKRGGASKHLRHTVSIQFSSLLEGLQLADYSYYLRSVDYNTYEGRSISQNKLN